MSLIETLRTPRIEIVGMKIAVFDLSMTLIAGYIIGKKLGINPYLSSVGMLGVGIIAHEILGIETEVSKKIKGSV